MCVSVGMTKGIVFKNMSCIYVVAPIFLNTVFRCSSNAFVILHLAQTHESDEGHEEGQEDSSASGAAGAKALSRLPGCNSSSATGAGDEGSK